jgi:hypothetical protein
MFSPEGEFSCREYPPERSRERESPKGKDSTQLNIGRKKKFRRSMESVLSEGRKGRNEKNA